MDVGKKASENLLLMLLVLGAAFAAGMVMFGWTYWQAFRTGRLSEPPVVPSPTVVSTAEKKS